MGALTLIIEVCPTTRQPGLTTTPAAATRMASAGCRCIRSGDTATRSGPQRQDEDPHLPQLGVGGQRDAQLLGQEHGVQFIGRPVSLDLPGARVNEQGDVLPTRPVNHTTPVIAALMTHVNRPVAPLTGE